jgi:hypothetical protein
MLEAGGATAVFGRGLATLAVTGGIAAVSIYGLVKAFGAVESGMASYNKGVNATIGNLGAFANEYDDVIERSMEMNVGLGKSWQDVAEQMSIARKAGMNIDQATDWATLKISMEGFTAAGKSANSVLDQIAEGKRFAGTQEDINKVGDLLTNLGLIKKIKPIDFIGKSSKEQARILTQNRDSIQRIADKARSAVDPIDKLKLAFGNMMAVVLGKEGQQTPLGKLIDDMIRWTENEENQKKISNFFTDLGVSIGKIDPKNIERVANSILGVASSIGKVIDFTQKHPDVTKILLAGIGGFAVAGLPGAAISAAGTTGVIGGGKLAEAIKPQNQINRQLAIANDYNKTNDKIETYSGVEMSWVPQTTKVDSQFFGNTDNSKVENTNQYDTNIKIETKATAQEVRVEVKKLFDEFRQQSK